MTHSLDKLIIEHRDLLVDSIAKDAVRQIPSYGQAPLRWTIQRVENWLDALADSIAQNEPDVLERHLVAVSGERRQEGFAIIELHSMVRITEERLQDLIERSVVDGIERNGLLALLAAVMGAARMVLSVRYMLDATE
jgi:hypothetical protein